MNLLVTKSLLTSKLQALWNIYTIYQFFNQYSQALSNGASLAGQTIDAIVAKVAPPVEAPASTSTLMKALGSTLNVVSIFTGVVPGASGVAVGFIRSGLGAAFDLSGKLGETLGVTQTADDRFTQLGDIGSSLAKLVEDYQSNLLKTVQEIQGNHTLFLAAAGDGGFSQRVTTSLTIQSSQLYKQLQLFVLSTALKANGIISSRSTGVKVLDFAKETSDISCEAFSEGGNCNQWWFDEAAGSTYALHNPKDWENTHIDLTFAIVDNGWATLDQIFKIEDCAGKEPTFDTATLGITCMVSRTHSSPFLLVGRVTNAFNRQPTIGVNGTTPIPPGLIPSLRTATTMASGAPSAEVSRMVSRVRLIYSAQIRSRN